MSHLAGSTFGIGTPATYPLTAAGWTTGIQPFALQPYQQSLSSPLASGYAIGALQPLQQLQQLVPQQLQQVQYLEQLRLFHLQQLFQILPAQLQLIQQLVQAVPQQLQHLQQPWQTFGSSFSGQPGFGGIPQGMSGPPASHVM